MPVQSKFNSDRCSPKKAKTSKDKANPNCPELFKVLAGPCRYKNKGWKDKTVLEPRAIWYIVAHKDGGLLAGLLILNKDQVEIGYRCLVVGTSYAMIGKTLVLCFMFCYT